MAGSSKVIITCALTGSGHTPSMSPHLPYPIEQVVEQDAAAAEAGAPEDAYTTQLLADVPKMTASVGEG